MAGKYQSQGSHSTHISSHLAKHKNWYDDSDNEVMKSEWEESEERKNHLSFI
jgi:hypothetical protein